MANFQTGELRAQLEEGRQHVRELLAHVESGDPEQRESEFPYLVEGIDLALVFKKSELVLREFATLDVNLATAIDNVIKDFRTYIDDPTRKRPHNLLIVAPPGSGKSHLVSCLAKSLVTPHVSGNLSVPDSASMLTYVVNEARNFKAQDTVPLIFLDEVDSEPSHYATLLPLLWDGELFVAGQFMKLGKCIVICAANDRNLGVRRRSKETGTQTHPTNSSKLAAFLSRFDAGVLEVDSINSEGRSLDKLCITAELIKRRFPYATYISLGLLQFFSQIKVEHEVRSLEFLVNLIPMDSVHRPPHVHTKGPFKPDDALLSLSRTYNLHLHERFTSLLEEKGELASLLAFHISDENRERAQQFWDFFAANIGLLKF